MVLSFNNKIRIGFGIAFLMILFVGFFSYRTLKNLEFSSAQVKHTYIVLERLNGFSSNIKDVQRAVRGFIISDSVSYLEPYELSYSAVSEDLENISDLLANHPDQKRRIDSIRPKLIQFLTYYKDLIMLYRTLGSDSAIAIVKQGGGKLLTEDILSDINHMTEIERSQLIVKEQDDRETGNQMRLVLLIGSSVALFFISASSFLAVWEYSRRTQAEEALRRYADDLETAKQKAESADHMKSAFLASMSHELRTPLNSIIGFSDIIQRGFSGPVTSEQYNQLGKVLSSAQHLLGLINDVLDISKIEAGKLHIEHWPFDARESIRKCIEMITPLAQQKELTLDWEIAHDVGEVVGDHKRVEQIIINILTNAVKFTDAGSVRLWADIVQTPLTEMIRIRVVDTGIGIKPEDIERLFQPFQQLHSGKSRYQDGTGLGLSICKKLSALLGGDVTVSSEIGKGSTFEITIPTNP